ncbi:hypothetical protein ASC87_12310 [Rhizobacter sp. Root1221]|nr:hypothetical protein ASC87_12310 [Rhizobacter sp. Root1221]
MWRNARLCSPVLVLAGGAAFAQTEAPRLEPVVVTATRSAVPLREVIADVTVIDRSVIERHQGGAVADLLRRVPGVQMARSGGPAGATSVYIRGGDTRFTAVLIDGVRVDTQTTGGVNWEAIPLSQIERIEVLRGPASAVYGSDAIGGVIQIFTRRGEPGTQFDVGLGGGDYGTVKSDASVSGKYGRVDFALSGLSEQSTGFSTRTTGNPDRDGYRSNGGSGRLGVDVTDGQRLEVSALRSHVDGQYDPAPVTAADDHALHDLESVSALWAAQWLPEWRSTLSFGQAKDHYATRPNVYTTDTRVRTSTWQNDVRLGKHTVNATLERREDHLVNTDVANAVNTRTQDAVALGWGWRQDGLAFQVNGRHDRNDAFGSANTGSIGAGVDVAEGWRVQSTLSNGFRAPTVYQQFSAEFGNSGLKAERSRSNLELALHHRAGAFESSATVYRNRITDLIVFGEPGPCSSEFGCYSNAGDATLKGVTLTSAYTADGLRIAGSIDFLSAKSMNEGVERRLARRAPRFASFNIDKDLGDTTVGAQWQVSDKRYDNVANTTVLGGYSIVNLDLQHKLSSDWRLLARVDNFFDKKYQLANTYVTSPMTVFVGVRWSPKI